MLKILYDIKASSVLQKGFLHVSLLRVWSALILLLLHLRVFPSQSTAAVLLPVLPALVRRILASSQILPASSKALKMDACYFPT